MIKPNILFIPLIALLLTNIVCSHQAMAEETQIVFDPVPTGLASRLVYDHWMHDPEYKNFTDFMKSPPHYMIAQRDVNDDGVAEIFARHADPDLDYCPNFGRECRLHIYRVSQGKLQEIGRMYSSDRVSILDAKTGGYHSLKIDQAGGKIREYVWNGQTYQPQ